MNKQANDAMDDGWVHPSAKTLPSLVTDGWKLEEKNHLVSDDNCNIVIL